MPLDRSEILSSLPRKGFVIEQRDHYFLFFQYGGKTQPIFTKVSFGSKYKTIDDSLISVMSRQLKLTKKQFEQLVNCPFTYDDYVNTLVSQQILQPITKAAPGKENGI